MTMSFESPFSETAARVPRLPEIHSKERVPVGFFSGICAANSAGNRAWWNLTY
jgi:hypothetical protein